MSGEEGAAGARNVSGKVNETFKVVRNSSTPDRSSIRFIALGSFIIDLASNYLELLRKKKKNKKTASIQKLVLLTQRVRFFAILE